MLIPSLIRSFTLRIFREIYSPKTTFALINFDKNAFKRKHVNKVGINWNPSANALLSLTRWLASVKKKKCVDIGYHVYKVTRVAAIGEELLCIRKATIAGTL